MFDVDAVSVADEDQIYLWNVLNNPIPGSCTVFWDVLHTHCSPDQDKQ